MDRTRGPRLCHDPAVAAYDIVASEIDQILAETTLPSASAAIFEGRNLVFHYTRGLARRDPPRPVIPEQPYDLASLTKPLAGVLALAQLMALRLLSLDEPLCRWLPHLDRRITARHLVQHSSGLPAWAPLHEAIPRDLWGSREARQQIIAAASRVALSGSPGESYTYSDLGFLVLLDVIERASESRIDEIVSPLHEAVAPGGLRWGWPSAAATEDRPDRGGVIEGVVHDPIAFAMGGVSSHAGLFGAARAVAALGAAILEASVQGRAELPSAALQELWADRGPGRHRGGLDTPEPGASTGRLWPPEGRGHLGYTGTSLWMAPRQRIVAVLLTNRVHPKDTRTAISAARPRFYEAVCRALGRDGSPRDTGRPP